MEVAVVAGQQAVRRRHRKTMSLASLRRDRAINLLIQSREAARDDNRRAGDTYMRHGEVGLPPLRAPPPTLALTPSWNSGSGKEQVEGWWR